MTIEATLNFGDTKSWLGSLFSNPEVCPIGMVPIMGLSACIDKYEVSAGVSCPHLDPASSEETSHNLVAKQCEIASVPNRSPWRYVTWHQAKQLCAARGLRLPTNEEWYQAALGTPDNNECAIEGLSGVLKTGSKTTCVSGSGAYDMIGNVWEYTADEVIDGDLAGTVLPGQGYISEVSFAGVPTKTTEEPNGLFNNDFLWRSVDNKSVVLRGGYYGSGEDGGLYSLQTAQASTFATAGVGFRCVTAN